MNTITLTLVYTYLAIEQLSQNQLAQQLQLILRGPIPENYDIMKQMMNKIVNRKVQQLSADDVAIFNRFHEDEELNLEYRPPTLQLQEPMPKPPLLAQRDIQRGQNQQRQQQWNQMKLGEDFKRETRELEEYFNTLPEEQRRRLRRPPPPQTASEFADQYITDTIEPTGAEQDIQFDEEILRDEQERPLTRNELILLQHQQSEEARLRGRIHSEILSRQLLRENSGLQRLTHEEIIQEVEREMQDLRTREQQEMQAQNQRDDERYRLMFRTPSEIARDREQNIQRQRLQQNREAAGLIPLTESELMQAIHQRQQRQQRHMALGLPPLSEEQLTREIEAEREQYQRLDANRRRQFQEEREADNLPPFSEAELTREIERERQYRVMEQEQIRLGREEAAAMELEEQRWEQERLEQQRRARETVEERQQRERRERAEQQQQEREQRRREMDRRHQRELDEIEQQHRLPVEERMERYAQLSRAYQRQIALEEQQLREEQHVQRDQEQQERLPALQQQAEQRERERVQREQQWEQERGPQARRDQQERQWAQERAQREEERAQREERQRQDRQQRDRHELPAIGFDRQGLYFANVDHYENVNYAQYHDSDLDNMIAGAASDLNILNTSAGQGRNLIRDIHHRKTLNVFNKIEAEKLRRRRLPRR